MSDAIVRFDWDRERLDLIKRTYAKGTSDAEFDLFIGVCKRLGLDPMAGQIHCVPTYSGQGEEQTRTFKAVVGIDGFRSLAEDTGEYEGQTKPEWFDSDTQTWVDVWYGDNAPVAARIGVFRKTFREPLFRVARYDAYVQTKKGGAPNHMWGKMHAEQLLKCAEALALRAAFPRKLSGVYTNDEMGQAQNEEPAPAAQKSSAPANRPPAKQSVREPASAQATIRWKAKPEYNGRSMYDVPSAALVEYVAYMNDLLLDKSLTHLHPEVLATREKCESVLRSQLLKEQQEATLRMIANAKALPDRTSLDLDIAGKLQAIVDGRLADPSDVNKDWGMNDESGTGDEAG